MLDTWHNFLGVLSPTPAFPSSDCEVTQVQGEMRNESMWESFPVYPVIPILILLVSYLNL
jgi:hypothetical protein